MTTSTPSVAAFGSAQAAFSRCLLFGGALLVSGCSGCDSGRDGRADRLPSALLVTIDCLRADHCSAYGYERTTTPNLDALAEEGVLFERSWAQAPFTAPSHASLFTGLHTQSHGVLHWSSRLVEGVPTFAGLFGAERYPTGAFLNHPSLAGTGVLDDFETVEQRILEPWQLAVGDFLGWLDRRVPDADDPFAAWVHLWDVHRPYGYRDWSLDVWQAASGRGPGELRLAYAEQTTEAGGYLEHPDPRVGRFEGHYNLDVGKRMTPRPLGDQQRVFGEREWRAIEDRYDNAVRIADEGLGALVQGLRERARLDDTILIVTADHGETLRERPGCWFTHDPYLYEETLRVPLVIRFPGAEFAGQRVQRTARGIDVLPTFLDVAGIGRIASIQGRSLLPDVLGDVREEAPVFAQTQTLNAKEDGRSAVSEGVPWVEHRLAVARDGFKLIRDLDTGREVLFDLVADPAEVNDLAGAGQHGERQAEMAALLDTLVRGLPSGGQDASEMSCEDRRVLVELGYLPESVLADC